MAESTEQNLGGAPAAPAAPNNPTTSASPAAGAPAAVDVQAQINQALAAKDAEFAAQLEKATGHKSLAALADANLKAQGKLQELAESKTLEASTAKAELGRVKIDNALLAASADALDAEVISAVLAGRAVCDDSGTVTIDGKPVSDAVKQLLLDKPFLAKAQGGTGSGAPNQADMTANGGKNPWSEKHFNLTEQSRIYQQDPALAEKLKAQAAA